MTSDDVISLLGLDTMPVEGGMWRQTWRDEHGSGIYFLLRAGDFSAMHRLNIAELWHHYAGASVEMLLLDLDGGTRRPLLGNDLASGQRPFVAVEAGVWMGAATMGDWSLVGTTMAPPFDPGGFELGVPSQLIRSHPDAAAAIARFIRQEHA